ncbi:MAG TPA: hypothetical protein VND62_01730 [Acidimicrobiales bacterium]|nr:hypothetical protein [Acidimicrobiales bacterium]
MAIRAPQLLRALRRRHRLLPALAVSVGTVLAGSAAYGLTEWVVSLSSGSSGLAQGARVSNIKITAVASPSPSALLYPHGSGDVVVKITNPNSFPVTITTLDLPSTSTYAAGYSTSGLGTKVTACGASASGSDVYWASSTSATSTTEALATPLTVAATGNANDPLTVTLRDAAAMGTGASATCEGKYFQMPSLKGVSAYAGGSVTPTSSPATDS